MKMYFHGNQLSWGIKHPLINLWSKYHFSNFVHLFTMLAPIMSSLDEIYCTGTLKNFDILMIWRYFLLMTQLRALGKAKSKRLNWSKSRNSWARWFKRGKRSTKDKKSFSHVTFAPKPGNWIERSILAFPPLSRRSIMKVRKKFYRW